MRDPVLIGNGQSHWGDSIDAPARMVKGGPLDYLTLDYLAEVTMSIMQRQRRRRPETGYARDFVETVGRLLPDLREGGVRVITNAGGVNPRGCAEALIETAREAGARGLKVAVIEGDDILDRLDELVGRGIGLENMETGEPLSAVRERVLAANVYIPSSAIADALGEGADIVLCGRSSDPGLVLAPMMHEFGWKEDDWDLLAAGTVAGHILECGAQCTGGNYSRWWEVPDFPNIGYPIAVAHPDGSFEVTKHPGTGGLVNVETVSEQLVYEMGDPGHYVSPDCTVDFTTVRVEQVGEDRVRVRGVKGGARTPTLKVSVNYHKGYKSSGRLTISGPHAIEKAEICAEMIWKRLAAVGYRYEETRTELVGVNSCHGDIVPLPEDPGEVVLRVGVRDEDRETVDRFGKELAALLTSGPPGITGFASGRPRAQEIFAFWPALIPREEVPTRISILES